MTNMEEQENLFKDWLISKHIEFDYNPEDNSIAVDDNLLRPYESELKSMFPEIEFIWEIQPKSRSLDN